MEFDSPKFPFSRSTIQPEDTESGCYLFKHFTSSGHWDHYRAKCASREHQDCCALFPVSYLPSKHGKRTDKAEQSCLNWIERQGRKNKTKTPKHTKHRSSGWQRKTNKQTNMQNRSWGQTEKASSRTKKGILSIQTQASTKTGKVSCQCMGGRTAESPFARGKGDENEWESETHRVVSKAL